MKDLFCVNEQKVTHHNASVDGNGDFVFVCATCEHFVKFPAGTTAKELSGLLESHEKDNTGQISVEASQKALAELLGEVEDEKPAKK